MENKPLRVAGIMKEQMSIAVPENYIEGGQGGRLGSWGLKDGKGQPAKECEGEEVRRRMARTKAMPRSIPETGRATRASGAQWVRRKVV